MATRSRYSLKIVTWSAFGPRSAGKLSLGTTQQARLRFFYSLRAI